MDMHAIAAVLVSYTYIVGPLIKRSWLTIGKCQMSGSLPIAQALRHFAMRGTRQLIDRHATQTGREGGLAVDL